jgi:hypothetical protein
MRVLVLALLVLWLSSAARAQISPGKLAEAHASLEGMKNCTKCHELGEGPSAERCLACHQEIAAAIDVRKGYHYRVVSTAGKACFECHGDHAGRAFRLIHWPEGRDNFDHSQAGWVLRGAHAKVKCRDCHHESRVQSEFKSAHSSVDFSRTFLGLDGACLVCHTDAHIGQFERECTVCHDQHSWKPASRFDHALATFPLAGRHATVECSKCHPATRDASAIQYTGIPHDNCTPCHTDPHAQRLGTDCASCHGQDAWKPATSFDHARTSYPLTGKHQSVECVKCHTNIGGEEDHAVRFAAQTHDNCTPCHADPHDKRLGNDCASCHGTHGWRDAAPGVHAEFNHDRTRFALIGRHAAVACEKCHKDQSKTADMAFDKCDRCHSDVHENQFAHRAAGAGCEHCHDENGFAPARFTVADHNETRFALIGAHLAQPCVACHPVVEFPSGNLCRRFAFESTDCEGCHADIHGGQFIASPPVKRCYECHAVSTWRDFGFDHDQNTRYRLEGKHRFARCDGCHTEVFEDGSRYVRYRGVSTSCEACHIGQDLQLGGNP